MDLQDVVDEVSRVLGTPATLEDRAFRLLAFSTHDDDADDVRRSTVLRRGSAPAVRAWFEQFGIATATTPVRTPASREAGVAARVCLPVRADGHTYGYLWAADHGQDDAVLDRAAALADLAGVHLARVARSARLTEARVAALLGEDRGAAEQAAAELEAAGRLDAGSPVRVACLAGDAPTGLPGHVLPADLDGRTVLVLARPDAGRAALRGVVAGVGGAAPAREASTSLRQARVALRVAQHVPALGPVAVWDGLGAYRLLAAAPSASLRAAAVDDAVERLLADPVLRATALAYLDAAGSAARTAEALHVHRQTLYHRLGRVEELTGLDLRRGQDRLRLHLGLTLAAVLDA